MGANRQTFFVRTNKAKKNSALWKKDKEQKEAEKRGGVKNGKR